ncbi:hypothetical protein KSP40_PGU011128 [Platanthera guangdongensis]|uniref:Leucine carboxyl methyltransferase 1 homolog n=1 Tax=Platanthera guangdongensis TaxID=2320717 RepID=A0ABR2LQB2_9ASPA
MLARRLRHDFGQTREKSQGTSRPPPLPTSLMARTPAQAQSSSAAVQATNDDATASKLSCVKKGYIKDDFVHFFVRRPVSRSPIINRGYFARWAVLQKLLLQFLDPKDHSGERNPMKKQILSLGAGFDTTYFQLVEEGLPPHLYVELDFMEVTSKKAALIDHNDELKDKVGGKAYICKEKGEVLGDHYKLLPVDLRSTEQLYSMMDLAQLDSSLPTFIIAECVLIYLDPDSTCSIAQWASETFSTAIFFAYEQILPDDAFGEQMMKNLEPARAAEGPKQQEAGGGRSSSRQCPLGSIYRFPIFEARLILFRAQGVKCQAVARADLKARSPFTNSSGRGRLTCLELFFELRGYRHRVSSMPHGGSDPSSPTPPHNSPRILPPLVL